MSITPIDKKHDPNIIQGVRSAINFNYALFTSQVI